jgi:peptide/nickel transport system substrate-binding protein
MKRGLWTSCALAVAAVLAGTPAAFAGKAKDTLVWTTDRDVETVDPYYHNIRETVILQRLAFDSLLERDPKTGNYVPLLAKSFKWIDKRTMEFDLREDVVFHNGKKFDADDVVYTFNFVVNPAHGVITRTNVDWIKSAEKLGPYKVRVHLARDFPAALEYLSGPTPILPKGHYDKAPMKSKTAAADKGAQVAQMRDYGALMPVGTGPYKITKLTPGQSFEMVANRNYFAGSPKGKPKIGKLVFRTIKDKETQVAELLTGGIDWIWDVSKDKAENLKKLPQLSVLEAPTMRVSYLVFDAAGKGGKTPFQDVRVRQAVAYAVNKEAIAKNLVGSGAPVVHSACYPSQFGCTEDVKKYEYSPEKAKKLLAEAGFPNGLTVDFYGYRERPFTEAVIGDLQKVGVKANLKWLQYKALREKNWDGSAQFSHLTWGSYSVNDASAITSHFFKHSKDDMSHDPEVKKYLDIADNSTDPEERKANYKKALQMIADKAYWVPLFAYTKFYAYTKDLDFIPSEDEIPRFYLAKWK